MEERESIHKGFKIFIIIFTVIVLLFINKDRIIQFAEGEDLDLVDTIEDGYDYRFINGEIIKYNDDGIVSLDDFNEIIVQKNFEFSVPVIELGEEYIYYADGETGDIYILNNKLETINQLNLDMKIFNIEETHKYIMIHSKEEIETLYSINTEGSIIYKNSPNESILNYDMGANTYAFSTLQIGDDIISTLHLYNFEGQLVDTMDFEDEVIFKISYSGDNIILLTDKSLYIIDREILWNKEYSLIKNILIEDGNIYLLYSNYLETLSLSGESLNSLKLDQDYDMIVSMEDGLILYGETDILIMRDDEDYKLSIDDKIKNVSGNGNHLIVNTEEYTNLYEFETTEE